MTEGQTTKSTSFDLNKENQMDLSVVIITRNEEKRITQCIKSVIHQLNNTSLCFEIILVDSNSTDDTIELAKKYDVRIIKIHQDELCSPSAGRFLGSKYAQGDAILFVDGDMELQGQWIDDACEVLKSNKNIAGVSVHLNSQEHAVRRLKETSPVQIRTHLKSEESMTDNLLYVDKFGGLGLYKKSILEAVGSFDPHMNGYEDVELGYRIRDHGYHLCFLPVIGAEHPMREANLSELMRRWNNGYYIGIGQAIRRSLHSPARLQRHLHRLRWDIFTILWLAIGVITVIYRALIIPWVVLSAIMASLSIIKGNLISPPKVIVLSISRMFGAIRGIFYPFKDTNDEYSIEHQMIRNNVDNDKSK